MCCDISTLVGRRTALVARISIGRVLHVVGGHKARQARGTGMQYARLPSNEGDFDA